MKTLRRSVRRFLLVGSLSVLVVAGGVLKTFAANCGPFEDILDSSGFCPFVLELYYLGIASGTSATMFSPDAPTTRAQSAVFVAGALNQSLIRGSRRAALEQWWTPGTTGAIGITAIAQSPVAVKSDGMDLWVAHQQGGDRVSRVRGSDGRVLEEWTGATRASGVIVAAGKIFITSGQQVNNRLYMIDPKQPPGAVTTFATIGAFTSGITFDGSRLWTANPGGFGEPSGVSIVTLSGGVTNVNAGFTQVRGILYDGSNVWVTDQAFPGRLLKLNASGGIIQSVTVGPEPRLPVFDGANIWVPHQTANQVTVVRASTGAIVKTLTGNGLDQPFAAAFDGQRILITNFGGDSVSFWRAADLTPLGSVSAGDDTTPLAACSDGINFWVTLSNTNQIARF